MLLLFTILQWHFDCWNFTWEYFYIVSMFVQLLVNKTITTLEMLIYTGLTGVRRSKANYMHLLDNPTYWPLQEENSYY